MNSRHTPPRLKRSRVYLKEAARIESGDPAFWTDATENDGAMEWWIGYWCGYGDNNPATLDQDERVILFGFLAAEASFQERRHA